MIDPQVCSIQTEMVVKEYKIEYVINNCSEVNSLKVGHKNDALSEMICAIDTYENLDPAQHMFSICDLTNETMREAQLSDASFGPMFDYKENLRVPDDRNDANRLVSEAQYYEIENGILYHFYHPRTKGHKWDQVKKQ